MASSQARSSASPILVAVAVSLSLMGDALLYAVLPTQAVALGIPLVAVGVLLSVNRFIRLVTNAWAGRVYQKRGRQRPFFWVTVLATCTTVAYGLPLGLFAFVVARAAWGVCWSFLRLGQYLAVLERADETTRGRWMGTVQAVTRIGTIGAVAFGGYLTDAFGFRPTAIGFGLLTSIGVYIAYRDMVARRGPTELPPPASTGPRPDPIIPGHSLPQHRAGPLPDDRSLTAGERPVRAYLLYLAGFAHGFVTSGLVMGTFALLLMQRFGDTVTLFGFQAGVATMSGFVLASRWAIDIGLAPLSGWLADRFGRVRTVWLGAGVQGLMLWLLAAASDPHIVLVVSLALFAASIVFAVGLDAGAGDLAMAGDRTQILGRFTTALDVGAALGPLVGFAVGAGWGLAGLYIVAGCLTVGVGGLFAWGFVGTGTTEVGKVYVRPRSVRGSRHRGTRIGRDEIR